MIEGLKGTVDKIGVTVSRKLTDGNYGSFEVGYYLEMSIADAEVDIDEQFEIVDTYLTKKVGQSAHDKEGKIHNAAPVAKTAPAAQAQPVTQHAGMLESAGETFAVEIITVEFSPKGNKFAKAKGGKWGKYGVTVWPEVLALPPLEWDLEQLAAADYPAPVGLTAIVQMSDEGKPQKVTGWA